MIRNQRRAVACCTAMPPPLETTRSEKSRRANAASFVKALNKVFTAGNMFTRWRASVFTKPADIPRVRNQQIHGSHSHAQEVADGQCEDVIQRQRADDGHGLCAQAFEHRAEPSLDLCHVRDDIAMQERCAFRNTGCPTGVLQECNGVGTQVWDAAVCLAIQLRRRRQSR